MQNVIIVQEHLRVYLDEKPIFNTHITEKINKASKGIGVIKKLLKVFQEMPY